MTEETGLSAEEELAQLIGIPQRELNKILKAIMSDRGVEAAILLLAERATGIADAQGSRRGVVVALLCGYVWFDLK